MFITGQKSLTIKAKNDIFNYFISLIFATQQAMRERMRSQGAFSSMLIGSLVRSKNLTRIFDRRDRCIVCLWVIPSGKKALESGLKNAIIMNAFAKNFFITLLIAFLIIGLGIYWYRSRNSVAPVQEITVKRGSITQQVNVTGQITPAQSVDLAFEKAGKVAWVGAQVGDQVSASQPLVRLVSDDIAAQLAQAQAGLAQYQAALLAAQAKLDELQQGTRPEELQAAQVAVNNAQSNLDNLTSKAQLDLAHLYEGIKNTLNSVYASADDAVSKQTEELFSADTSPSPKLSFTVWDFQVKSDVEFARFRAGEDLSLMRQELDGLSSDPAALDQELAKTQTHLTSILDFLNRLNDALNAQAGVTQSTVSTYRGYIGAGRSEVTSSLASITNQMQAIASQKNTNQNNITTAKNSLGAAQSDVVLKQAGSTPQSIRAQEAGVAQAQANISSGRAQIANIQAQLSKSVLVAPIAGILTKQEAKVGQIVSAYSTVASIISQTSLEIEANIPEVDIGKIVAGNPVTITIDALPGQTFKGKVIHIDPAQTVIDGVINFKVRVSFDKKDVRFKSGLTANLSIETLKKNNALLLPQVAILENDKGTFVQEKQANETKDIPITTGIRAQDGSVEILSGVSEGQRVLNVGSKI